MHAAWNSPVAASGKRRFAFSGVTACERFFARIGEEIRGVLRIAGWSGNLSALPADTILISGDANIFLQSSRTSFFEKKHVPLLI